MTPTARKHYAVWLMVVIAALCYGTLYPLSGWQAPLDGLWAEFSTSVDRIGFGDIVTNSVVYIPLGYLLMQLLIGRCGATLALILAVAGGTGLSLTLEVVQAYLPGRVSSWYDLALNSAGSLLGAMLVLSMSDANSVGRVFRQLRKRYVKPGSVASLGLGIVAIWLCAQLVPFVPSLDVGNLKTGIKPLVQLLSREIVFSPLAALTYVLSTIGIAIVLRESLLAHQGRARFVAALMLTTLALKVLIVGRQISFEALLGTLIGLGFFRIARYRLHAKLGLIAFSAVALLILTDGIRVDMANPGVGGQFNWIPFRGHLTNDLIGVADLIDGIWPYIALALTAYYAFGSRLFRYTHVALVTVIAITFWIEWQQRFAPGRLGDITDVVIAAIAWFYAIHILSRAAPESKTEHHDRKRRRGKRKTEPALGLTIALLVLTIFGSGWLSGLEPVLVERPLDESKMYRLPLPQHLPPVKFDEFRAAHPRLPSPSSDDIELLREKNSTYLERRIRRAKNGEGNLNDAIFAEFIEPQSQDLDLIYERLLRLEFVSRGNGQVKPLALAVDWLYDRWSPEQQKALTEKLADGCDFIINVIREKRLSPYNVYLYNSPLQALVACSIANYGESPRGNLAMRFTYDYWNERVLPVWRQVMGTSGGWHEGGEYVGIGIGGAVYQIPAMWRYATGVDYFRSEPGIAGFLDFLIYRSRPDGTQVRFGDTAFVDRRSTDRNALASEFQRRPAFGQERCRIKSAPAPSSWPWGPVLDRSLCEMDSPSLPLTKVFDGIGWVVSRTSWDADATYVTYKAGDNFWSHTHLDQGAFTIFKNHALAVDSGLYGPRYGSDHHMNYTYQSIAHNVVTVTDPTDTIPAPRDDGVRHFANDGGQRRIGSGWGIESAPLDVHEWQQKAEIYETGDITKTEITQNYTFIDSDLTAAYTNKHSGEGTFSHRTRRVEQYERAFVHDKKLDMVVVFDRLQLTDPSFQVRWLLHSQTKPSTHDDGFDVVVKGSAKRSSEDDGGLAAHVALPVERNITKIGGPGFEFFVDGKNYNESGQVYEIITKRKKLEPGSWRVELQPSDQDSRVEFLVFMFPWSKSKTFEESVACESSPTELSCMIYKDEAIAEYRFDRNTGGVVISHEDEI